MGTPVILLTFLKAAASREMATGKLIPFPSTNLEVESLVSGEIANTGIELPTFAQSSFQTGIVSLQNGHVVVIKNTSCLADEVSIAGPGLNGSNCIN
jgi:hypothetical protein